MRDFKVDLDEVVAKLALKSRRVDLQIWKFYVIFTSYAIIPFFVIF